MSTGDEGYGLFVIHSHATEGFTNITSCGKWIRVSVRSFRVDVNQTHLHSGQWILEFTVTRVALVCKPCCFRTPVYILFWLPYIGTATSKAEGLEAHRLESAVTGEDHKVGP